MIWNYFRLSICAWHVFTNILIRRIRGLTMERKKTLESHNVKMEEGATFKETDDH